MLLGETKVARGESERERERERERQRDRETEIWDEHSGVLYGRYAERCRIEFHKERQRGSHA